MMTMFNYIKSDEAIFNDIVDGAVESVEMSMEGVKDQRTYSELQKDLNSNIAKYLTSETRFAAMYDKIGADVLKNPNVTKHKDVRSKFDAVIAQIINVVIPLTTSKKYGETFMDIHQIGWGDTARFLISSNDLFKVNEVAEGIHRATLQPIFNNEVTVNCGVVEVATSVDWYLVAAGNFDWGQFGLRAGRSFEGYIMLKAIAAMASATAELGAAYTAAGISTSQWTALADRVSAANAGSTVYALGTLNALNQVAPATVGLQYGLGEEIAKEGFLNKYLGVSLVPIDQAIIPGTVNTTAKLAIPTNVIYLVAADQYKPVKVVFEGDSVVVEAIPEYTTDKVYGVSIQLHIGVAAVMGSKYAAITLPQA